MHFGCRGGPPPEVVTLAEAWLRAPAHAGAICCDSAGSGWTGDLRLGVDLGMCRDMSDTSDVSGRSDVTDVTDMNSVSVMSNVSNMNGVSDMSDTSNLRSTSGMNDMRSKAFGGSAYHVCGTVCPLSFASSGLLFVFPKQMGHESSGAKSAPFKTKVQLMLQVPQAPDSSDLVITSAVLMLRVKKRIDLF